MPIRCSQAAVRSSAAVMKLFETNRAAILAELDSGAFDRDIACPQSPGQRRHMGRRQRQEPDTEGGTSGNAVASTEIEVMALADPLERLQARWTEPSAMAEPRRSIAERAAAKEKPAEKAATTTGQRCLAPAAECAATCSGNRQAARPLAPAHARRGTLLAFPLVKVPQVCR